MSAGKLADASVRRTGFAILVSFAVISAFGFAPSVATALSTGFDSRPVSLAARGGIGSFTPASADPELAASLSLKALSRGQLFRFTPVRSLNRPGRSVTVAVRVDRGTAAAISVRKALAGVAASQSDSIRIAPTAYNLGVSRGYESFALPAEIKKIEMPDLAALGKAKRDKAEGKPGRFNPRIALEDQVKRGRDPRTLEGQGDYSVDVGGSYRLIGNLDVTAGVRYSSERDRIAPVADATQDSQAVYVGTQFRF